MHPPAPDAAPMNLLMLTKHRLNNFGVAEVMRELSQQLIKRGVRVCCYSSNVSAREQPFGPDIPCFHGPLPRPGRWWTYRRDLATLQRVVREQHIDLIHCHNAHRPGYAALLLKRKLGLPYVVTSHSDLNVDTSTDRDARPKVRRHYPAIIRNAAALTHLTADLAEQARYFNTQPRYETVIPNGVNLAWWRQGGVEASSASPRMLLAICRLVEQKGVHRVVAGAARIAQHMPLALVIAGTGPERANLMRQAHAAGMHVSESLDAALAPSANMACFPGMVMGEAKRQLFQRSWAVTLSSPRGEAFPVMLLEAMAAERPVIATDIRAARAVLEQTGHGLLVSQAEGPAAWAEAISRLWTEPSLYRRLADAAREAAPGFDWSAISEQYLTVYREACSVDSRPQPELCVGSSSRY